VFVVFVAQASADWMWESTAVAVFALIAIGVAATESSERREHSPSATRSVGLVVAAALAIIVLLPGLSNQRQIDKSQAEFRAGDFQASLLAANKAIDAQSWSATAFSQRALALEAAGQLSAASVAIAAAERKEPYNWRWPFIASRIYVKLGESKAAQASFARARALRRYSPIFGIKSPPMR
jgi:tetratricopeptide (TPR) repeat protein